MAWCRQLTHHYLYHCLLISLAIYYSVINIPEFFILNILLVKKKGLNYSHATAFCDTPYTVIRNLCDDANIGLMLTSYMLNDGNVHRYIDIVTQLVDIFTNTRRSIGLDLIYLVTEPEIICRNQATNGSTGAIIPWYKTATVAQIHANFPLFLSLYDKYCHEEMELV